MQGVQSDAALRFPIAAWRGDTACGYSDLRNGCSGAYPQGGCQLNRLGWSGHLLITTTTYSNLISTARRSLSKTYSVAPSPDSSSSEYQSLDNPQQPPPTPEAQQRPSLLSRLFRRSGRQKTRQIDSYNAQFPPTEWFNSRTVHLHNVGTQTNDQVSGTATD